ncbi:type IV secretion system protein [Sphingomonas sp. AR_OL41]|uniref:type IV secretion system protein n=1 Tax=Sphingomonas sp. AR_OL41 TaxID=3042729 RepID=UPI00247FC6CA|nr:type IV secretion system protein [Sphingomonas sp. AR_OL41]MDH7973008.1 type IV secretion system protein [Sphingomonas sp. AR_OL41]
MQGACPSLAPDSAFVSGVLGYVDCEAQALGLGGWQGMTGAGSANALILTGMLTIFIALIGYRMLLGETPTLREGVVAIVKIGIVLALATSWGAFRTLVYDVAMHGPAELAAQVGGPSGLPGAGGGLIARLQNVDSLLIELNTLGTGKPLDADVVAGPTQALSPQQQQQQIQQLQQRAQRPKWDPANDAKLLSQARTYYLTGIIAAFASVRIVTGLLLGLGPLFVLFLLFDGTRGLFEGWVRGLIGAALGALSTAIVLGIELALLEPWLAVILAERRVDNPTPEVPVELLVVTLAFGLTLIATLVASGWVARGFRMPVAWRVLPARIAEVVTPQVPRLAVPAAVQNVAGADQRSRAIAVSDAVAASQRREAGSPAASLAQTGRQVSAQALSRDVMVAAPIPLGQSFRRRTRGRISSGAARRDGGR